MGAADCDQAAGEGGYRIAGGVRCQIASDDIGVRRQRPAPGEEMLEVAVVGAPGVRRCGCLDEMQNHRIGAGHRNRGGWGGGDCAERSWF